MPLNALLINPWVSDFKLYDEWMHPLGLYELIGLLNHNGWHCSFFNCLQRAPDSRSKRFGTGDFSWTPLCTPPLYETVPRRYKRYGCSSELLTDFLNHHPTPDAIFVGSGMTYWLPGLSETVHTIRTIYPTTPLFVGGIAATLLPARLLKAHMPSAHFLPGPLPSQGTLKLPQSPFTLVCDGWRRELLTALRLLQAPLHGPLALTRGCPMRCSYCASHLLQPRFEIRPLAEVLAEVELLTQHHGVDDFAFYDDALLINPEQGILPFLEAVKNRGLRFHVPNGMHLKALSPMLIEALLCGGVKTLRFGYESGNPQWQRDTCGKASRELTRSQIKLLLASGYTKRDIGIYIMAGLPHQDEQQVREEIEFIGSLGVMVKPVFLSPVPGTALFESLLEQMPELANEPLLHNDTIFVSRLPGWSFEAMQRIRDFAKQLSG